MVWIVLGEKNGFIQLVSKGEVKGMLPKGAYLTIQEGKNKFIIRVGESQQSQTFSPSPMLIDMDLNPLSQDQKCQNIISAYRVKDIISEEGSLIEYIKPLSKARRSTQEEIDIALGNNKKGAKVFISTIYAGRNKILNDEKNKLITAFLPEDMFYHQTLVCGATGSGKTVATKYLAQYFVEELGGAVLAINVKEADFLKMDKQSEPNKDSIVKEWKSLGEKEHPISNFVVYYPAGNEISPSKGVNPEITQSVTLNVKEIDPESLIGLLQGITDKAAESLPNVFRFWQEREKESGTDESYRFTEFRNYFERGINDQLNYNTMNIRGDSGSIKLARGTYDSILRKLDAVAHFFDNEDDSISLTESDILIKGKMSVIDVNSKNGIIFGSILLRNLLNRIVLAKGEQKSKVPILIIIDEVKMFYSSDASTEALGDLDIICRTGRSSKIGVIFSSQNPTDIPSGLSSVINTKILFKSSSSNLKSLGMKVSQQEMECLQKGYAVASIHDMPQLKFIKFPLAFAGVFEDKED
jgi:hypothetical protein